MIYDLSNLPTVSFQIICYLNLLLKYELLRLTLWYTYTQYLYVYIFHSNVKYIILNLYDIYSYLDSKVIYYTLNIYIYIYIYVCI